MEAIFEKMGIKPCICKCCGGKMHVIQIIPNQFRKKNLREPPCNRLFKEVIIKASMAS